MDVPQGLRYTKEHEWARLEEEGTVVVGVTDFAQESLGDIVFVELPNVSDELESEQSFGVIESVKTVSDLYSPVDGEIVDVNGALVENPEVINEDPYGEGWLIKLKPNAPEQIENLMNDKDYKVFLDELE